VSICTARIDVDGKTRGECTLRPITPMHAIEGVLPSMFVDIEE
jgi:hypothetical protein